MGLTPEEAAKWSRYGMAPYNWILDGKLLASVYPKDLDYLVHLRDKEGILTSVNLSESPWPAGWIEASRIYHHHFPVIDMSVPTEEDVRSIISLIDSYPGPVMVHCAAGIGRTGTVIALYLVEHGMEPEKAISLVREKRGGSIQTMPQEMMVRQWAAAGK
ncbi:MAG: dual specificity protein phosphatase family protein [Thermoplasmatota archaeon]